MKFVQCMPMDGRQINSYVLHPPHPQRTDPSPSLPPIVVYYAPPHHAHSHPVFSFVINSLVDSFLPVDAKSPHVAFFTDFQLM